MPLKQIFTHRLIRLLRVLIPLLLVALVAIPAWNYVARRAQRTRAQEPAEPLSSDLAVRTEGFTFSRTEGDRTLFTIRAKRNLGFKDNRNMLEDVEVTIHGSTESEPTRRIRGRYCSYDQETQDIRFEGAVEVQLDDRTTARSEELTYNHRDRLIASSLKTVVEQGGGFSAQANSLEYKLETGLLQLSGAVEVETADRTQLLTSQAAFHQKENWTSMTGGIYLRSAAGWIRGTGGRAELEPGSLKPKLITIDGNVRAELQPRGARDSWELQARWVRAAVNTATGNFDRVETRGDVEVRLIGNFTQVLTAGEMDASFNAGGEVARVHARQNAKMTLGSDRTLESADLWVNHDRSIETGEGSVLQMGDATITGRQFAIQQGETIVFATPYRATLRSGSQESSADRTRATFAARTNTLRELSQSGNFRFKDETFEANAMNAVFEEGGTVVTIDGSPVVTDAEKRLEADQIRLNRKDNSFVATKNVRTVFSNAGTAPVLVKAARAEGGADSMLYTGSVELWRDTAYIKAESIRATSLGKTNRFYAEGRGNAKVQTDFNSIRTTSDTLDYDEGRRLARYKGNVRARKQDMILETPDLTLTLAADQTIVEITASDGVVVSRGSQRGFGSQAVYNAASDSVTLTGSPAKVHDNTRATVEGARLTIMNSGEVVVVEGGKGGRTVTTHPVRKK